MLTHVDTLNEQLRQIVQSNSWLVSVLQAVRRCNPPDWYVGGGVIRNIVWDYLSGYSTTTPVNDVDVAFFDPHDLTKERDKAVTAQLTEILPCVPWQAKNQAAVHLWYERVFGFPVEPVWSTEEAIATWPETVTAIGIRLLPGGEVQVAAPCGLDDLFRMVLRRNPRRVTLEQFRKRLHEKRIVEKWPAVTIIDG